MITKLYNYLYKVNRRNLHLFIYRFIKIFLNLFYPLFCLLIKSYNSKNIAKGVIVSLTSFPDRINTVWITVETLLRQTYKPDRIILWIAKSQFNNINSLPKKLLEQRLRGLEIKFCEEDLRSHKKYYYVMNENPDSVIITVDDDTFYPENLIENLMLTHKKHPNAICCNLAHVITTNKGEIQPYTKWILGANGYEGPSDYLIPIGCEGVLYPPKSLNENLFNMEQIKELCPYADDLWLKSMATLNGTQTVKSNPKSITFANIISASKFSLNKINIDRNLNDNQIRNIINKYPKLREVWK